MLHSPRFLALGGLLLMAALFVRADDEDDGHMAQCAHGGAAWMAEIDAGEYDQSYNDGGSALHEKVPQDTWVRILKTERPMMGNVVTRTETEHSYRPNGFEGADGEFFVISYRTRLLEQAGRSRARRAAARRRPLARRGLRFRPGSRWSPIPTQARPRRSPPRPTPRPRRPTASPFRRSGPITRRSAAAANFRHARARSCSRLAAFQPISGAGALKPGRCLEFRRRERRSC